LGLLAGCAVTAQWAWRALGAGSDGGAREAARPTLQTLKGQPAWLVAALLGAGFIATHWLALAGPVGAPQAHAYAAVVWTLAGFHMLHVAVAALAAVFVTARIRCGYASAERPLE